MQNLPNGAQDALKNLQQQAAERQKIRCRAQRDLHRGGIAVFGLDQAGYRPHDAPQGTRAGLLHHKLNAVIKALVVLFQVGKHLCTLQLLTGQLFAVALAALRLAKSRGVPVLAIVNVVGSSIARAADYVLYTYAGPEIAVASTKAYMVQLCTLYLFAFRLAYARGRLSEAETRRLTAELLRAGEVIQPRLADCEQIKYLASRFVNTQSCFFIGRGFDYALSLEGSLKLKEISYVHSDAYAAGELKHGTISLITDGVPVIALATQKQVYEKTISNAKETKSRGARVILFTTKDVVVPEGVADYVVRLDDYDELLMPLQLIVPLQLFAYYMAVLRGCDVDKPRNLAKSVTVE